MIRCFLIPGEAVGQARPRVTRHGTYTPAKSRKYKELVRQSYLEEYPDAEQMTGPIRMDCIISTGIPKSASRQKKMDMITGKLLPTKKPDIDNIEKAIQDALNGLAYEDDKQIIRHYADKQYSETPCVLVYLRQRGDMGYDNDNTMEGPF